ncbi:BTAD domain-containing putative transcriptional regulator [Plantactinospora sp. CA-290183]|uniref:AfsR/SARP family transcriptional regulator n=1 Tax=Plantactinospora sp. CA-290183 TaxID=3240006 RepID=UPI003D8A4FCF
MADGTRFFVQGPLRCTTGGREVNLGPLRQQAVLAVLLFARDQVVTPAEIVEAVWGGTPPASGRQLVPSYVYRLRRMLGADGPRLIESSRHGYLLRSTGVHLDSVAFERAVGLAEEERAAGNLRRAATMLGEALGTWSGEPLAGLPGPFADAQRRFLAERRLAVLEQRIGMELEFGQHAGAVPELQRLTRRHPHREHLTGLYMIALHRSGRQAEALEAYQCLRIALVEQLGIEPGDAVRSLHQAILRDDPALRPARPAAAEPQARPPTRTAQCDLPRIGGRLVGREAELTLLVARDATAVPDDVARLQVITGMPGVGKTTLGLRAARMLAIRYPDAQLYLDLRGHAREGDPLTPADAALHLLRGLGVAESDIPDGPAARLTRWRAEISQRRAVLLLDDVLDSEQVAPLLTASPDCHVLVTSRHRMAGLEPDRTLPLGPLARRPAEELFTSIVGEARVAAEPDAAAAAVARCEGLPLAIRVLADRLNERLCWRIAAVVPRLNPNAGRLAELRVGRRRVDAVLRTSFNRLTPRQLCLLRAVALLPTTEVDSGVAAAAVGGAEPAASTELELLAEASLLTPVVPGLYRLHGLLREALRETVPPTDADDLEPTVVRRAAAYHLSCHRTGGYPAELEQRHTGAAPGSSRTRAWAEYARAAFDALPEVAAEA